MNDITTDDLDTVPMTVLVKRALNQLGPSSRAQLAAHLHIQTDELARVSSALGNLKKRGEIILIENDGNPNQWKIARKHNGFDRGKPDLSINKQPTRAPISKRTDPKDIEPAPDAHLPETTDKPYKIHEIELKISVLERLSTIMADDITGILLNIRRDLQSLNGTIPTYQGNSHE